MMKSHSEAEPTSFDAYRQLYNLEGQVAMVTGGAGGIGSAICEGLAAFGATVVICGRTGERAEAVAAKIQAAGGHAWGAALDIREREHVRQFVDKVIERHGRLDVLVNSAGINTPNRQLANLDQAGVGHALPETDAHLAPSLLLLSRHVDLRGG